MARGFRRSQDTDFPAPPGDFPAAPGMPGGAELSLPSGTPTATPGGGGAPRPQPAAPAPAPGGGPQSFQDIMSGAAAAGQTQSEDYARFGGEEFKRWKPYLDSSCPPGAPFRSMRGAPGCYEKPTECPDGTGPQGPNETDPCGSAGYGGGGGGAGGGGGDAGVGTSGAGAGSEISSLMERNLKGMLEGGSSRYSPEAMQGLLAQIKQRIESSKRNQLQQATSEAAARGMSRSGRTGTNLAAIRRGAEAEFTGEYGKTLRAKIDADRQDKLDALDRSQRYLDSLRDELYRRDMSAIQRQQFKANLDLAYANLANQREALASSQQHQRDMLGAQYGYQSVFGG